MKLYEYIIRRLILLVFVLFAVSAIIFYFTRGFPTSLAPWTPYINNKMTADQITAVIKAHGFDKPLYEQYFYWLQDIFRGDWGATGQWGQGRPANQVFFSHFPYTIELAIFATFLTITIGIPLGVISALKNNKPPDHISRIIALAGYSTPVYWFGFLLQLVFFYYFSLWGLPYLPSSGASSLKFTRITGLPLLDGLLSANFAFSWDEFTHLILPSISLSFISLGFLARIVRASMLEVLRQDYITMARSKGLKERVVIYRHALKNALIPAVTLTGIFFAGLLGGAMITEYVFSWPGVGQLAVRAIYQSDSNFILVYSLVFATIIVFANLVVDVLYAFLDPRIKY
jgi:ABC-type dipeptide/oligopeptide/nickel transport system permease component